VKLIKKNGIFSSFIFMSIQRTTQIQRIKLD